MAKGKKSKGKSTTFISISTVVSILFTIGVVISTNQFLGLGIEEIPSWQNIAGQIGLSAQVDRVDIEPLADGLSVHIMDVGQADCILIQTPDANVLIDAGDVGMGKQIVEYLTANHVEKIDYLINTHAHADHLGGMGYVVDNMQVNKVIATKLKDSLVPTTKVYSNLLTSIANKGLKITAAEPGMQLGLGEATLTLLGPVGEFNDLNASSIASRLEYGDTTFLFTGDTEKEGEKAMLGAGYALESDVLSVAHHGSNSSTTKEFLAAVSPKYASISVGKENKYNHPSNEVVARISKNGTKIYRTDENGTIVFTSNGKQIEVITGSYTNLSLKPE